MPSIETLEKIAKALEIPLFQIFCDDNAAPALGQLPERVTEGQVAGSSSPEQRRFLRRMAALFNQLSESDRQFLLAAAKRMAGRL